MAKRRRAKKSSSRTIRSNSTDSGSALLGLAVLLVLIVIVAVAVGIAIVLIPLILIPMWMICKEWSRGIKMLISVLVIVIWLLLLPFALGFLREIVFQPEGERAVVYSENTPYPTTAPIITNFPLPTSTPITLPTLTKGMSGEDVATLQNRLIALRYLDGKADGQFGPKTERAVMDFQKKNGILENGIADTNTLDLLFSDTALGYYSGDLEWITRDNNPQYYGDTAQAHAIWDDVDAGKIIFADTYDRYESGRTILYMNDYSSDEEAPISDIEVYIKHCNPPEKIEIDEATKIAAYFFPYEIVRQWHEHGRSYFQPADKPDGDSYYICYYHLSEKGKIAHDNKEHSYPGAFCVVFVVNPDGFVDLFHYTWGVPDSIGSPSSVDWDFDFMKTDN